MTERQQQEQQANKAFKQAMEGGKRIRDGKPTKAATVEEIKTRIARLEKRINAIPTKKLASKVMTKAATAPARAFKMISKATTSSHTMKR